MTLGIPKIMGILNVTTDSFFSESRAETEEKIRNRILQVISEGADIIDIGGCSTRPSSEPVSESEEMERVDRGCRLLKEIAPDFPLSVDTFRSSVARMAIEKWNANIINDISGGSDPDMWNLVASKNVVYVLTHNKILNRENSDITSEVIVDLSKKINKLHHLGVNDVIIDPGFGFGKTLEENFKLFEELNEFASLGYPLLVGVSRKSMIYKTLGTDPENSLIGTVALDAIALEKGADILRVHDVKEAIETVRLFTKLKNITE